MNFLKLWKIWLIYTVIFFAPLLFEMATGQWRKIPVRLEQGFTAHWRTWRPFFSERTSLLMDYQIANRELAEKLLGEYSDETQGVPLLVHVGVNGKGCVFEQTPIIAGGNGTFSRDLLADDGEPDTYHWQQPPKCHLPEHAGWNDWQMTVTVADTQLRDIPAMLIVPSPYGGFKFRPRNIYGTIGELNFWWSLIALPLLGLYTLLMLIITAVHFLKRKK